MRKTVRRRPPSAARSVFTVLILACLAGATPRAGQSPPGARYWCFDYVLKFVTGVERVGTSVAELRDALRREGYRAETYATLDSVAASGEPGDVLILGQSHAALFIAHGLVNHYFGETYQDARVRSWTLADLSRFTRAKDPSGASIVPVQPFKDLRAEIWSPRDAVRPLPSPVEDKRCRSLNPTTGLRCRDVEGHAGAHQDWAARTWVDTGGGGVLDRNQAARVALLLQNVRRLSRDGQFDPAVDALTEARRLAGSATDALAEQATTEAIALRSALSRSAVAALADMQNAADELTRQYYELVRVNLTFEDTLTGGAPGRALSQAIEVIRRAEESARNDGALSTTSVGDPHKLLDEIRQAADAACAARDIAAALRARDTLRQRVQLLERAADRAKAWQQQRSDPAFDLGRPALARARAGLADTEQTGSAGLPKGAAPSAVQARAAAVAASIRTADSRLKAAHAAFESITSAYQRVGTIIRFGEDHSAEWRRQAAGVRQSADEHLRDADTRTQKIGSTGVETATALSNAWREAVPDQTARLARLERLTKVSDTLADQIEAVSEQAPAELQRADACVQALQAGSARPPAPPQSPAPQGPTLPATGVASTGGGPPPQRPALSGTTQQVQGGTATSSRPPTPPSDVPVAPRPVDPATAGGIRITGGAARIMVGQRVQFIATDYGNRPYTANLVWMSLREDLLSIDDSGWATGLRPGRLTIQARHGDDMLGALEVEVVPAEEAAGTQPAPATAGGFRDLGGTVAPYKAPPPAGGPPQTGRPGPPQDFSNPGGSVKPDPASGARGPEGGTQNTISLLGQAAPQDTSRQRERAGAPTAPTTDPRDRGGASQPGSGSGFALNAQRFGQTTIAAGQPAAWHIFATGSRLGWAGGLGRYSVGPADASIVEDLRAAGEHAMWANRLSYAPTLAWTGWQNMRATYRSLADQLQRTPADDVRRRIAVDTAGQISGLAQVLNYQTVGTTGPRDNCDAAYVRLGFYLGYGAQVMQIADEAVRNGDRVGSVPPRQDALRHLQTAASILIDYERVTVASGRCADLRDVRTIIEQVFSINANDVASQAVTATRAWELANVRIAALGGAAPADVQRAQSVPTGQPSPAPQSPPASARDPLLGDPGELAGYWAGSGYGGQRYILRFTKQGDEYVGAFEEACDKDYGYSDGEIVFRGRRVGANAYEGTYRVRRLYRFPAPNRLDYMRGDQTETVSVVVAGAILSLRGPSRTYPGQEAGGPYAASYILADMTCSRLLGPQPWRTPEGSPLDHVRHVHNPLTMSAPIWFVAHGQNAAGQVVAVAYPDVDAVQQDRIADVRQRRTIKTAVSRPELARLLRKDALSEAWLQHGFVTSEGPMNFYQVISRLGRLPAGQR